MKKVASTPLTEQGGSDTVVTPQVLRKKESKKCEMKKEEDKLGYLFYIAIVFFWSAFSFGRHVIEMNKFCASHQHAPSLWPHLTMDGSSNPWNLVCLRVTRRFHEDEVVPGFHLIESEGSNFREEIQYEY
ncbi:hypothetical protein E2542_SST23085 [Spatholobus suberectus]|nr:hypothetical protein E2542_SST23085 [Spatholobus suberectus]